MFMKTISFILIGLILNLVFYPISIRANQTQDDKDAKLVEKIKKETAKLGVNEKVKVKLKDGTKLKGYITEIKDQYFVVTNNGQSTTIQYSQAKQVKIDESILLWGKNSPKRAWIGAIVVVILIGIITARSGL